MLINPRRVLSFLLASLCAVVCASHAFAQNRTNGRIAFVSVRDGNAEIYTANPDGTNQTRLTDTPAVQELTPAWSPDGTRLAFTGATASRAAGGTSVNVTADIYVINADGGGLRRLTNNSAYNSAPVWSPDGARIAFTRSTINPQIFIGGSPGIADLLSASSDIHVIGADGSNETNLTRTPLSFEFFPAWSPDGRRIAYTNATPGMSSFGRLEVGVTIFTMNVDGSNQRRLLPPPAENPVVIDSSARQYDFAPAWSPDVSRLAFTRVTTGVVSGTERIKGRTVSASIYVVNADGTNELFLNTFSATKTDSTLDSFPSWSPDGTKITFTGASLGRFFDERGSGGDVGVYVANANGSGAVRLTRLSPFDFDSDWGTAPATPVNATNKIDEAREFVRQQYLDFLGREPDAPGWDFWTREITECSDATRQRAGESGDRCVDRKRVNTSGAFFLSEEHQATGYYVYRLYRGVLGSAIVNNGSGIRYVDFLADQREAARGIVVNDRLSPDVIERNKQILAEAFVKRARLDSYTNDAVVDILFRNTGVSPTAEERRALVEGLNAGTETRTSVVRKIVDGTRFVTGTDGRVAQEFTTRYGRRFYEAEFNRAFVLMQYFGYLRREPDREGYEFWLAKLDRFGNFREAEMVRAFIVSDEYRSRFGRP